MPAAVPAMEGQLKKRGAKIGVMHDRYCVATREVDQALGKYVLLCSFKNRKSYAHHPTKPSSSTAVRRVADWDGRTGFSRHENAFQMETFDGQLVFCAAPSADEKARWLAISPAGDRDSPVVERTGSSSELKQLGRTSSVASTVSGVESGHRLSMRYLEQGWCSQGGVGSNAVGRGDFKPSDLPLVTGFARDADLDGAESFTTESESGDAAWAEFMTRGTSAHVSTEDTREDEPEEEEEEEDGGRGDDLDVARSVANEEALTLSDLSSVADDTSPVGSAPRSASFAVPRTRTYSRGCSIVNDTPSNHAAKLEISDLPLEPVSVKVARLEAKLSGTDFSLSAAGEADRESDLSSSSRGSLARSLPIKQEESVSLSAQPKSAPPTAVPAPVPTPVAPTPAASSGTAQEVAPTPASSPVVAPTSVKASSVPAAVAPALVSVSAALPPVEEETVKPSPVLPSPSNAVRAVERSPSEPSTPTALSSGALKLNKDKVIATGASKAAGVDVSDSISTASTATSSGPLTPPPRVRAYSSAMLNSLETFSPPTHPRVRRYSFNSPHPAPGLAPHMLTMSSPLKPNFVEPHLGYVHSSISMMVPSFSTLLVPLSRQQSLDVQSEEDDEDEDDGHFFAAGRKPRAVSSLSLSLTQESDIDEV